MSLQRVVALWLPGPDALGIKRDGCERLQVRRRPRNNQRGAINEAQGFENMDGDERVILTPTSSHILIMSGRKNLLLMTRFQLQCSFFTKSIKIKLQKF